MRGFLTGVLAFFLIYVVPLLFKFIESAIFNFPRTVGIKGIKPATFQLALALFIWGVLYLISRKKRKNK